MIKIDEQGRHKYFNTITVDGNETFCIFSSPPTQQAKQDTTSPRHQPSKNIPDSSCDIHVLFTSASLRRPLPSSRHQQVRQGRYLSFSCRLEKVRRSSWTTAGTAKSIISPKDRQTRRSYLGYWFLLRTDKTEKGAKHTEESKQSAGQCDTSLWVTLQSKDRVSLRKFDEGDSFVTDERNGILFPRGNFVVIIQLVFSFGSGGFEGLLDLKSLSRESLGILNGMANDDVIEENVLGHGPEFDADTALQIVESNTKNWVLETHDLLEALSGVEVLKKVRVGDLTRGPFAFVCRVVNHRWVPFAFVVWVGLEGTALLSKRAETRLLWIMTYAFQGPQPGASSHFGLRTVGAIQSPSSSSSHSSGFSASGSGMLVGSSSSHPSGFLASASTIS